MDQISMIAEPLRKLLLTGNSLEPNKEEFVLTHVNRFIAIERRMALSSIKKKNKQEKNSQCNEDCTNSESKESLTKEVIDYAELAVRDWEHLASGLIKLLEDGKGQDVLNSLNAALQISTICKESVVFCLLILIKKSSDVKLIADGYSNVRNICKTTNLFLLFLQFCKIYATANSVSSGWGRGMKRAVRNWYLNWEPRLLALEVTRYPSAYTWSHKDVLKMAHINIKELPVGHGLVLHYIFSGFASTKKKYEADKNATDLMHILEILNEGANEIINSHIIVERGKNIINSFGSVSLNDFPHQALSDVKVMSFLLENGTSTLCIEALANTSLYKLVNSNAELRSLLMNQFKKETFVESVDLMKILLAYNSCRRICAELIKHDEGKLHDSTKEKHWMNNAPPNPDKSKKIRSSIPRPKEINDFFGLMIQVISKGLKGLSKPDKCPLIFIDLEPSMEAFIAVSPENPISKEIRATQAITFLLLSLTTSNLPSLVPFLSEKVDKTDNYVLNTFSGLLGCFSKLSKFSALKINVNDSLKFVIEKKSTACVLIYFKLTKEIISEVYEKFKAFRDGDSALNLRVIVCGLDTTLIAPDITEYTHPDLLFLFGFNRYTLPVIQAFTNDLL